MNTLPKWIKDFAEYNAEKYDRGTMSRKVPSEVYMSGVLNTWNILKQKGFIKEDAKWYGRIGYDNEGIVKETEYKSKELAEAYVKGALDMKEQSDADNDSTIQDHWAVASDEESIPEA